MTDFERPADWTDEQWDGYFGTADDPMDDESEPDSPEILDMYALYDPSAFEGDDDEGTVA